MTFQEINGRYKQNRRYRLKTVTTIRKEYNDGESPLLEEPAPTNVGEDIVYSP